MIQVNFKKLSIVALVCLSLNAFSTNYYISNTGNDAQTGTSEGSAWATIDKLNSATLSSGDNVYFERGGVYFGAILLKTSGVTYSAYGSGDLPVITGYAQVTGWENQGGNIWRAVSPATEVKILVVNNESQPLGRYPNGEWLEYEQGNGSTGLTDNDNTFPAGHWNYGECVTYSSNWTLDAVRIAAHTGTDLIFSENLAYSITNPLSTEQEYFIQNHPNTLDMQGEWANWEGHVYLYSTTDPNTQDVQVSSLVNAFTSSASVLNNVTIENLKIFGFNGAGVRLNYYNNGPCENPVIQNCEFEDIGDMAVNASGVTNLTVRNSTFTDILNNGVYMYYCYGTTTQGNTMTNIGTEFGRGGNGNGTYTGIEYINGTSHTVTGNDIKNVGYRGISMAHSANPVITENIVDGACTVKTDGGAIYAWNRTLGEYTGGEISRNIVNNVHGSERVLEGVPHLHSDVYAIYIDDDNMTLTISDNVVMNSATAIFIHNSQDIDMINNTIYNCKRGIYFRSGGGGGDSNLIGDCDVTGNKILHTADEIPTALYDNTLYLRWNRDANPSYPIPSHNTFDQNYYLTPFTDDAHIRITDSYVADNYTVTQWQQQNVGLNETAVYQDLNSFEEPIKYDPNSGIAASNFVYFDWAGFEAKTVNLIDQYVDVDGVVVTGEITIQPLESIILFKTNETYDISNSVPTDLEAVDVTDALVELTWRPAVGSVGVVGFEIYRDGSLVGTSTTTSYTDNSVSASSTYSYQVLAYDAASSKSGLSGAITVTTLGDPGSGSDIADAIPTNLTATNVAYNQVSISWTPATGDYGVVGYEVHRDGSLIGTSTSASYTDNSVSASTSYNYTVRAYDASNNTSGFSSTLSVTTPEEPSSGNDIADAIPVNLTATSITHELVSLQWQGASGDYGVVGYEIHRDGIFVGRSTTTSYTDNSVSASTTYSYNVMAYNEAFEVSGLSQALEVTTNSTPEPGDTANNKPVIVLEYDVIAHSGIQRSIDASGSFDPDNDNLQYFWNVPGDVSVSNTNSPILNFLAVDVKESETREFELFISDGITTEKQTVSIVMAPYKPSVEEINVVSLETSNYDGDHYPENVLDGSQNTYWSSTGDNEWICLELEKPVDPSHIKVAYFNGEQRKARFDLYISTNNVDFEMVDQSLESCGYSSNPHVHDFPETKSSGDYKYVKLVGRGSDVDENNTLSEIKIFGLSGTSSSTERLEDVVDVYPNPAISSFNVELDREANVRLLDLSGKVVMDEIMQPGVNEVIVTYPAGTYVLQVISEGKALSRSIVIQ